MESNASRVLIVDDMPINRMIISSILATNGVLSDQTDNGHDALLLCESHDYDLILMDHRMPGLDGVDTFIQLKDIFATKGRDVPVVCHTTEEGRKNINLYKAAGFADVLIKPIEPRQLSEVLLTYLPKDTKPAEPVYMEDAEVDKPADKEVEDELDKLPLWLKTVPHIDLVSGITSCDTAEDYVDALYVFYSSIQEKSGDIEHFLEEKDYTMYTLSVHSLKSMARLIGAKTLANAAADLEKAAKAKDYNVVEQNTPTMLMAYRKFDRLLSPLMEDESIKGMMEDTVAPVTEEPEPTPQKCTILFIQTNQGIVTKGIENHLRKEDFSVITIPDEPDMIITYRYDADIIIYYPSVQDESHISITMNLLGEICQDDTRLLCLTGDPADLEVALSANGAQRVSRSYPRPVNIQSFIHDMENFSILLDAYHRRKNLFVVDDDADYLSVIERWLSADYSVSAFNSGNALLTGLSAALPDLILLDYEMPELNGYELMKKIRTNSDTKQIPIIFLTGKNDREHVFRILEYKPDGYLLKSSRKEDLLDAIHRFFAESLFKQSTLV